MKTDSESVLGWRGRRPSASVSRSGYHLFRFIWTHPEVKNQRLHAVLRALAWQIWQRTFKRPWRVALSPSIDLLCYPHSTSAAGVLYCGYPEWREMRLMLDVLRPGDHFIDVGANVGVYSLLACTLPGVQVWAFEPSTQAAERAAENICRNRLEGTCHLFRSAVGRTSEQGHLTVGLGTMNRIAEPRDTDDPALDSDGADDVEAVDIVALDDAIPPAVRASVALIKIDVEGDEMAVLEGATTLLTHSGAIVIVEANEPEKLSSFFATRGFVQCSYEPNTRQLILTPRPLPGQVNSIYIHDMDAVRERLAGTPDHTM